MKSQTKQDLFDQQYRDSVKAQAPLADRLRPQTFAEYMGQEHVIASDKPLRQLIEHDQLVSIILWGPPGSGKTTLAKIIANTTKSYFVNFSAAVQGTKELREYIKQAVERRKYYSQKTIVFIDEIHRFNKSQQDVLLPYVEKGIITLIGATTENPSFEVNSALLSRSRVFVLSALKEDEIKKIVTSAVKSSEENFGRSIKVSSDAVGFLARQSQGDARIALNSLEFAVKASTKPTIGLTEIKDALQKSHLVYDKKGENHYNIISALHKSMRGSDANASLYWVTRMLESGEEPLYVARRVVRFASEDVGLADNQGFLLAVAAYQACHFLGMPECNLALAQAVVHLARAKKDNSLYAAYQRAQKDVQETFLDPVPLHLRNAPTDLMKDLGYGKDYKYNPNFKEPIDQEYLPENLRGRDYFAQ